MDGKMSLERRKDGSTIGMHDEFRKEGQEALYELRGGRGDGRGRSIV